MVAKKLANTPAGRPKGETASIEAVSQDAAAKLLNVSRAAAQRAAVVQEKAAPELVAAGRGSAKAPWAFRPGDGALAMLPPIAAYPCPHARRRSGPAARAHTRAAGPPLSQCCRNDLWQIAARSQAATGVDARCHLNVEHSRCLGSQPFKGNGIGPASYLPQGAGPPDS